MHTKIRDLFSLGDKIDCFPQLTWETFQTKSGLKSQSIKEARNFLVVLLCYSR